MNSITNKEIFLESKKIKRMIIGDYYFDTFTFDLRSDCHFTFRKHGLFLILSNCQLIINNNNKQIINNNNYSIEGAGLGAMK